MALKRTAAEEILGEWGVRDVTPPSANERERVARDRDVNPLVGRPLPRRIRRFRPDAEAYVASLGGPLPYMQRLRQIDDEIAAHLERLEEAYVDGGNDPERWRRTVARWDFEDVNELIEKHNRWYPIEARLAMDPRSRDFVKVGGRDYRRVKLDAEWALTRFPA
jgi:hypothetical protein